MIGRTIAQYRIEEELGRGGMGVVYRAFDTRLGRAVALKVLPDAFAADAQRMARFRREAQLLAALNHPGIAAIYGFEESRDANFLVLELVPGKTLAEFVARGPLPVPEALEICGQIAEAVSAAHDKGIIHRDLKPANIKVTPAGKVKVLDFGLAKAAESEAAEASLANSPTISELATRAGVLLGTAAYMSPEQARGKPVDKRTDVWAFGCLLFELLAGQRPFGGETVSDSLAGILAREPDWNALPAATPPGIQRLLRRCLQKDAQRRLHDLADARLEIEEALAPPGALPAPHAPEPVSAARRGRRARQLAPWAVAAASLLVAAGVYWIPWRGSAPAAPPVTRFEIVLPPKDYQWFLGDPALAISPDGSSLVYVAGTTRGPQLFRRRIDEYEATPIPGTEGAKAPFFSPDGQWVGFFADGKLKKVSLAGGAPFTIATTTVAVGGTWAPDDSIIFAPGEVFELSRVSSAGGHVEPFTNLDSSKGEVTHRWPQVLPGGKALLFTIGVGGGSFEQGLIALQSLEPGANKSSKRILIAGGAFANYSPTGHLLYARGGTILSVPFDLDRLEVTGKPSPVLDGVMSHSNRGMAQFAISAAGDLFYMPGAGAFDDAHLVWVDLKGNSTPLPAPLRPYRFPRLSPDSRQVVIEVVDAAHNIWVYDTVRGTLTRLTFESGNHMPQLSPDGKRVVFSSQRLGPWNLYWKLIDGSGPDVRLTNSADRNQATSWSPDGKMLLLDEITADRRSDIRVLSLDGPRQSDGTIKPQVFLATPFSESGAQFSPDGRWVAYVSDESGRSEVYLRPFSGPGGKIQVSTDGGGEPLWSPDGRTLFYRNGSRFMAAEITDRPARSSGKPRLLFEKSFIGSGITDQSSYAVSRDARRLFMVERPEAESQPVRLRVVRGWSSELARQNPVK